MRIWGVGEVGGVGKGGVGKGGVGKGGEGCSRPFTCAPERERPLTRARARRGLPS